MPAKPAAKSDQIYESLRQAIVRLDMPPGSPISEKDICAAYDVSRTPVREALQRLAEEDLVTIYPHSGTWVSRISFSVAEEGFVIRRALEVETALKRGGDPAAVFRDGFLPSAGEAGPGGLGLDNRDRVA